jgi:hypothetical protein
VPAVSASVPVTRPTTTWPSVPVMAAAEPSSAGASDRFRAQGRRQQQADHRRRHRREPAARLQEVSTVVAWFFVWMIVLHCAQPPLSYATRTCTVPFSSNWIKPSRATASIAVQNGTALMLRPVFCKRWEYSLRSKYSECATSRKSHRRPSLACAAGATPTALRACRHLVCRAGLRHYLRSASEIA